MSNYADDDAQLQLALELSKKTAEEESRSRNGERVSDIPKVHDIKLQEEIIGAHLRSGFKDLKEQNLFSDITLEVGDEKIPSHRIVLCAWSETFKVMLENDTWKESQQKSLKIQVEEKEYAVFKILLHYMYYGEAKVTTEHVIPLLSLANYYAVLPLKENCGQILGEQLNDDNVFHLLDLCEKFSVNNLRTLCAEYLAENFGALLKADKLQELDPETWAEMLKSDEIQVTSEEEVFNAVMRYSAQFDKEKRIKALETILPNVRFPFLSSPFFIENVDNNSLLTSIPIVREIIHETYKYKVYPKAVTSIRTKPRKTASYFENVPNGVKVSDDRLTATNTNTNMQWVTTKISPPLNKGNRYREILLGQMSMNGFFIGVATSTVLTSSAVNFYPGQYGNSWSYEGSGGSIYHNGGTTYYGGAYRTGDRIGIEVDLDQGKLRFYKNGVSLGDVTSYHFKSSDLGSDDLYACVTFYTNGDSVTLLPVAAPTTDNTATTTASDANTRPMKKPALFGTSTAFKF